MSILSTLRGGPTPGALPQEPLGEWHGQALPTGPGKAYRILLDDRSSAGMPPTGLGAGVATGLSSHVTPRTALGWDPGGLLLLAPGSPCLQGLPMSSVCPCLRLTPWDPACLLCPRIGRGVQLCPKAGEGCNIFFPQMLIC